MKGIDLNTPLNKLNLSLNKSWVAPYISQLRSELKAKGLKFCPHFWIGEEWFCSDGVPGISIPFFILEKRFIRLELRMVHEIEGAGPRELMKLLRHECGHAIDNAFYLRRKKKRQKIFGLSSKKYPKNYIPREPRDKYVKHLEPSYAQAHPDEDWAETFAIWLDPKSNWKNKYKKGLVREKLNYMDSLMGELKGVYPYNRSKEKVDPISASSLTLREYYLSKRIEKGLEFRPIYHKKIYNQFSLSGGHIPAANFLKKNRREIYDFILRDKTYNSYQVSTIYQKIIAFCSDQNLKLKKEERVMKKEFSSYLKKNLNSFIRSGEHKVIM